MDRPVTPALVGVLAGDREHAEHTHDERRHDQHPDAGRAAQCGRIRVRHADGQAVVDGGGTAATASRSVYRCRYAELLIINTSCLGRTRPYQR